MLLAALAVGPEGYTDDAWAVIQEERERRGLTVATAPAAGAELVEPEPPRPESPLPGWLSISLLTLASLFILVQVMLLLKYYGWIDRGDFLVMPSATLAFGLTAWTATRFIRVGPHHAVARKVGWVALLLTGLAILVRTLQ